MTIDKQFHIIFYPDVSDHCPIGKWIFEVAGVFETKDGIVQKHLRVIFFSLIWLFPVPPYEKHLMVLLSPNFWEGLLCEGRSVLLSHGVLKIVFHSKRLIFDIMQSLYVVPERFSIERYGLPFNWTKVTLTIFNVVFFQHGVLLLEYFFHPKYVSFRISYNKKEFIRLFLVRMLFILKCTNAVSMNFIQLFRSS